MTWAALAGSKRVVLPGAIAAGKTNAEATIEVTLKLRGKNTLPQLHGRPAAILSKDKFADTYGASASDIDLVVQTFAKCGLNLVAADAASRSVRLSGTVAAMEDAFQVRLLNYTSKDHGDYRGRVGSVFVPLELQPIVKAVFGLDDRRVARRRKRVPRKDSPAEQVAVPAAWFTPEELATRYSFPAGDGSSEAIGVLEFGGGFFAEDLSQFCTLIGSPVPEVTTISTDGTATNARDGAEGEVMLDIEVIAGICPKAHIIAYFAQWTEQGWIRALDYAVHDKTNDPSVLSISWGNAEDTDIWTAQAMNEINQTFQEAAMLGISVCVAAGDDGSSDAVNDGHAHLDFPASSPFVLSIGGTTIPQKDAPVPDRVWFEGDGLRGDGGGSTGGGVSAIFERPEWQKSIEVRSVNPGAMVGRCVPDIAANADWNASPYLLVVDGKPQPNGGTSAAAPLCAALLARINGNRGPSKRLGYVTPLLYAPIAGDNAGPLGSLTCVDIDAGSNATDKLGGYSAGPGYDAVSGWGTPHGEKLAAALAQM